MTVTEQDLPSDKMVVPVDALTPEQVNEICADLFARVEENLETAKEMRDELELRGYQEATAEESAESEKMRQGVEVFRARAFGHVLHMCELREYWKSQHPGEKLPEPAEAGEVKPQ